ncbi:MAG: hypothetical protein N3F67_06005 [Acidilobaceae archaeon]|nr:hypothetical protein [Acidilobaceae archaeon]
MSAPFRPKAVIAALRQPLLLMLVGWSGVVALTYLFSIPASQRLPSSWSALLTLAAGIFSLLWLASWRALAISLIRRNLKR